MLFGFIALILIGVALIAQPLFSSVNAPTAAPASAVPQINQGPAPEVPRVSVDEAHTAYQSKQAIFVDVRDKDQYEAGHVSGALSIPLSELDSRLNELDPAQWIITYCT
jgi:3-mercaptopyruvate sulfurtransferase SseA